MLTEKENKERGINGGERNVMKGEENWSEGSWRERRRRGE